MIRRGWRSRAFHRTSNGGIIAVIAVKCLEDGKSRLVLPAGIPKRDLILAMLEDELAAVTASRHVTDALVVTSDGNASAVAQRLDIRVVPDVGAGLNAAFDRGRSCVPPDASTLMLPGDLPCLTGTALDKVLSLAHGRKEAVVPDLAGLGTAMLVIGPGSTMRPSFGADSFRRHVAQGAAPLKAAPTRARLDVDTLDALQRAHRLGLGPRSRTLLEALGSGSTSAERAELVPAQH